jgi:hypothetical protein
MKKLWNGFTNWLDRVPASWGIPTLLLIAVLMWLGILKLFGI